MNDLSKVSIKRIEGLEATIADIYAKLEEASGKGTAHSVGEVFWSQSNIAEENIGALPLFTGDHVSAATYSALHAFILRHNELVKTKQEYDALVADTTKDCPYYAIDNGQIYLPIIRNYLKAISTEDSNLLIEDTTLYPWVSYVATVHDIVTPTEYAKADLSNVTGIEQHSAVNAALEGKQDVLPAGTTGYYLQKTETGVHWANVDALPSQTGQSGKFLTTDGTDASWSDKPVTNTATVNTSLTILGTASTKGDSVNIGYLSSASSDSVAVGSHAQASEAGAVAIGVAEATGMNSIGIGRGKAKANYAIQLGYGTNTEANSMYVGTKSDKNWKLLGSDGTIPVARLNTMTGATASASGTKGAVPAPAAGDNTKFLRGDGTWANVQGGGGGVSITVQNYENNTGTTLATGLTLTDFSTILVYKNGVLLTSGANNEYTISTNDIVFTEPLLETDKVTLICFGSAAQFIF